MRIKKYLIGGVLGFLLVAHLAEAVELVDANGAVIGTIIDEFVVLRSEGGVSFVLNVEARSGFPYQSAQGFAHAASDCSDERRFPVFDRIFPYRALLEGINGFPTSQKLPPSEALGYYPAPPYEQLVLAGVEVPGGQGNPCFGTGGTAMPNGNCCVTGSIYAGEDMAVGMTITVGRVASFDLSKFVPPFTAR